MIRIFGFLEKLEKSRFNDEVFEATIKSNEHEDDIGPVRYRVQLPEGTMLAFQASAGKGEVLSLPVVYRQTGKDGKHYLNWHLMKRYFEETGKGKKQAGGGDGL